MKNLYMMAAIAALAFAGAAEAAPKGKGGYTAPQSRQEAIAQAKEQVARLEKMTDQEWAEHKKKRADRRAKIKAKVKAKVKAAN